MRTEITALHERLKTTMIYVTHDQVEAMTWPTRSWSFAAADTTVNAFAPLERIPVFVPAGAMISTTDTADMRHLHDEPSRVLRIFPGRAGPCDAMPRV